MNQDEKTKRGVTPTWKDEVKEFLVIRADAGVDVV